MPTGLSSRSQQMVADLISYFEQERDNNGPFLPLTAVRDRVAAALKLSVSTVNNIAAKLNKGEVLKSPSKKRERTKPVVNIDDFDQIAIRNVIYEMYRDKVHITLKTLQEKLVERDIPCGCLTSLWKIVKNLGFKYRKDDPRRGLMELPSIALKRINFLQQYIRLKKEGLRQFVFLDETWIFQDGTIGRSWQDSSKKSVKKNKIGGKRYIVLHAGCAKGFIPGAELIYSSSTRDADYHGEMNEENFLHWFEYQLLVNLEEPSTIVMDNASYHSTLINKAPTTASKKADIQRWLEKNNINFEPTFLKPQLLNLVKIHKPQPVYKADELAQKYGHHVLRLPPYHCIFNPIEHIWGITKNYYRDHIGTLGSSAEKSLAMWKTALAKATPEVWANTVRHTESEIQRWWDREVAFDREDVPPLIIEFNDDDSSADSISDTD